MANSDPLEERVRQLENNKKTKITAVLGLVLSALAIWISYSGGTRANDTSLDANKASLHDQINMTIQELSAECLECEDEGIDKCTGGCRPGRQPVSDGSNVVDMLLNFETARRIESQLKQLDARLPYTEYLVLALAADKLDSFGLANEYLDKALETANTSSEDGKPDPRAQFEVLRRRGRFFYRHHNDYGGTTKGEEAYRFAMTTLTDHSHEFAKQLLGILNAEWAIAAFNAGDSVIGTQRKLEAIRLLTAFATSDVKDAAVEKLKTAAEKAPCADQKSKIVTEPSVLNEAEAAPEYPVEKRLETMESKLAGIRKRLDKLLESQETGEETGAPDESS